MQGQKVGKLSIDKDENYHFKYDEIIKALNGDIIKRELLIEEESVFIAKLSAFIVKRANRFREIGLKMAFVSFP